MGEEDSVPNGHVLHIIAHALLAVLDLQMPKPQHPACMLCAGNGRRLQARAPRYLQTLLSGFENSRLYPALGAGHRQQGAHEASSMLRLMVTGKAMTEIWERP